MGCASKKDRLTYEIVDKNRECQDIAWTLIFIAFCAGIAYIGIIAHEEGDPALLSSGSDSFGNICGRNNRQRGNLTNSGLDLNGYKYTYYARPTSLDLQSLTICVDECPSATNPVLSALFPAGGIIYCTLSPDDCKKTTGCLRDPYVVDDEIRKRFDLDENGCPKYVYAANAEPLTLRCVPALPEIDDGLQIISAFHNISDTQGALEQIIRDLDNSKDKIIILLLLAFAASFFFVISMRCCAGPIIYLAIACCILACLVLTGFLGYRFYVDFEAYHGKPEYKREEDEERNLQITGVLFGACFIMSSIFVCLICAMRKKIYSAVQLYEEAAEAVCEMPTIFCVPFCSSISMVAWMAGWGYIMVYLSTSPGFGRDEYGVVEEGLSDEMQIKLGYMLLAFFWLLQMIIALEEFIVASTIVIWYLQGGHTDGYPLVESIWRVFRYHFGSLCLGSLIIAAIQFVRTILEYIEYKAKDKGVDDSKCIKYFFKCLGCLLFVCERCIKFLNKNAYIEIAIWGDSFCVSCTRALSLLLSNIGLTASVNGVGFLLATIIKVLVVASVGIVSFYWFETDDEEEAVMYAAVALMTMVMAYFIADAFTDTFEMAGETLLFCWLEDYKTNRDEGEFMVGPDDLVETMLRLHGEKRRPRPSRQSQQRNSNQHNRKNNVAYTGSSNV